MVSTLRRHKMQLLSSVVVATLALAAAPAQAEIQSDTKSLVVPLSRSSLVTLPNAMSEIMVANPDVADVHAHNATSLSVVGKRMGHTTVRVLDKEGRVMKEFLVTVSQDLPAIRRALKNFLPDENIGVEVINTSIALTGQISNASVADTAIKIVQDFVHESERTKNSSSAPPSNDQQRNVASDPSILNLMKVVSGQQVMLRVRVGEINRVALKNLGVDLNYVSRGAGSSLVALGTGGGVGSLVAPATSSEPSINPGVFLLPGGRTPTNTRGVFSGRWQPDGANGNTVSALIKALERDGLFKLLAEPNLVAISGEGAEFLAGGEIPIPVVQGGASNNNSVSIEYKPFGVSVKFTPFVLTENRIRMAVMPEVSEISSENAVIISGFSIPSISTRRAKTTVELAPGESFMIAGLIKDESRATIEQLPGVKELPVLGALFRSNEFQRKETELVIAVTPYIVDPLKSSDVKLPTDNMRHASQMEMFFYGALGSLSGNAQTISQSPGLEGPIGFMVD